MWVGAVNKTSGDRPGFSVAVGPFGDVSGEAALACDEYM